MVDRRKKNSAFHQLLNSKKFLVLNEAVLVAIIGHKIGLNLEIQFLLVSGFLGFVGIQGAVDIRQAKKTNELPE